MQSGSQPPQGYIGAPEAARMVGVHQETIRNWLKDKKLEGFKEYDPETKRERYWVTRESVNAKVAEKETEPERIEAEDQLARRTEDILMRIADQERTLHERLGDFHNDINTQLDKVEERQGRVIENLGRAVEILEDLGERSKSFQERMLEMLEEEREYLRQQREELGYEERRGRGFWARLFGRR